MEKFEIWLLLFQSLSAAAIKVPRSCHWMEYSIRWSGGGTSFSKWKKIPIVYFSRLEARFAKLTYSCNMNFTVSMLRVSLKIPTLNQWNGKTYENPIFNNNMPFTKIECQWMTCIASIRVPMRRHSWDQIISICLPQTIVLYPNPNIVTCTLRIWLREIGFALSYGALMLKTWR